jgi:high affinity Mn2+ porin
MTRRRTYAALLAASSLLCGFAAARGVSAMSPRDEPSEDKPTPPVDPERGEQELFSLHFQSTMVTAYHPAFSAKYSGPHSMSPDGESATALVSTLYADRRLWPGGEFLFNPEISGGKGLSSSFGVAAFPTGIVYRVGDPAPAVYVARLAISQTIGLGGGRVTNEAGPNELADIRDRDVLAITVGRFSVEDVFDGNRYAHDATERFFNWALFASGAWDYPADTRGYTWGVMADAAVDWWSVRAGIALEPKYANEATMDWRVGKSHGLMAEYEARYTVNGQHGALSTLIFLNSARMGSYAQVLSDPARYDNKIENTRQDGRLKYGMAVSLEQQLRHGTGMFLRLSANDGATESWAFTEIDRSAATGVVQDGALWHRDRDEAGAAFVLNGLSSPHRAYLAGGGLGFILGDGALNYAPEMLFDTYYKLSLADNVSFSAIYQPVINPGYNRDRGPVHVLTGRLHVAF